MRPCPRGGRGRRPLAISLSAHFLLPRRFSRRGALLCWSLARLRTGESSICRWPRSISGTILARAGKSSPRLCCRSADGAIPTRAEKSGCTGESRLLLRDHPRAGGEITVGIISTIDAEGPSPRGRGNRGATRCYCFATGTIPARAGKSEIDARWRLNGGDHPRAGGETLFTSHSRRQRRDHPRAGGETMLPGTTASRHHRDHPRAGGETYLGRCRTASVRRDHPRAGGETTVRDLQSRCRRRDHPRAGGETASPASILRALLGDHPRAGGETR